MGTIRNILIAGAIAITGAGAFACTAPEDPGPGVERGVAAKDASTDVKPGTMTKQYDMVQIPVRITNHSEKTSDYYIEAAVYDSEGVQVDTALTYVVGISPGTDAAATLQGAAIVPDATTYKIITVERTAS